MKPPKNIERIRYLAYHHKKARVRKKNLKRLQKYYTQTFDLATIADAVKQLATLIGNAFSNLAEAVVRTVRHIQRPCKQCSNLTSVSNFSPCYDCIYRFGNNDNYEERRWSHDDQG